MLAICFRALLPEMQKKNKATSESVTLTFENNWRPRHLEFLFKMPKHQQTWLFTASFLFFFLYKLTWCPCKDNEGVCPLPFSRFRMSFSIRKLGLLRLGTPGTVTSYNPKHVSALKKPQKGLMSFKNQINQLGDHGSPRTPFLHYYLINMIIYKITMVLLQKDKGVVSSCWNP